MLSISDDYVCFLVSDHIKNVFTISPLWGGSWFGDDYVYLHV